MPYPARAQKKKPTMNYPRLRIAFITLKFGHQYGGAESYGVELMHELAKHHDVFVYTHEYDSNCTSDMPYTLIPTPKKGPSWWRAYCYAKNVEKTLADKKFDIVHSHVNGWVADVDVLHVKSVRHHWITKANPLKRIWNKLSPRIAMYLYLEQKRVHTTPPRRTVVVSELLKTQLQKAYQTTYPFDVITPGVHLPTPNHELRYKTRQRLGFTPEDQVCILVARNPRTKGLNCLLTALKQLPATIKLLVVGVAPPKLNSLLTELKQQGLSGRVTLVEQTPTVNAYYYAADFGVHPTLNDSFGMAPLEAMSHGLPVIVSQAQYCGFSHYLQDQKHAILLQDPQQADELALAIKKLSTNADFAQSLSTQGLALAQQFSWENIARRYLSIYAEVIATKLHRATPTLIDPLTKDAH